MNGTQNGTVITSDTQSESGVECRNSVHHPITVLDAGAKLISHTSQ
jgi:hypothetical protein